MDLIRRCCGSVAVLLAGLAAAVTLGHLLGPHGHVPNGSHGHHAHEESDCLPEAGDDHGGHAEVNCGYLVPPAPPAFAAGADRAPGELTARRQDSPAPSPQVGPNGRAPPERSELQVERI